MALGMGGRGKMTGSSGKEPRFPYHTYPPKQPRVPDDLHLSNKCHLADVLILYPV
jgi:hypothetical protein